MTGRRVVRDATDEEALQFGFVPGTRFVVVDETLDEPKFLCWTLPSEWERATRRCRWMLTKPRRACGEPPAGILWRSNGPKRLAPWAYCSAHLYGRVIEGGRILALQRIEAAS